MTTTIKDAYSKMEGQTEVKNTGWSELPDAVSEEIADRVGDIEMHHFEADLWVDDDGTEYFEWEAEVRLLYTE